MANKVLLAGHFLKILKVAIKNTSTKYKKARKIMHYFIYHLPALRYEYVRGTTTKVDLQNVSMLQ